MKSKAPHVIYRNSNMFCSHCGTEQVIPYPIVTEMLTAMSDAFIKLHAKCEKTWKEPEVNQEKTEKQKAEWWLQNGERGTSSETIWGRLMGMRIGREDHPYDPDDFSRCYKLLKAVPEWRAKLNQMKAVSPAWSNLVDNWDKLTEMFEENERTQWKNYKKIGMYEFMKKLIN